MEKLSKQSEAKLLEAVDLVASLVNDGEEPNDAIVKIASERKIPRGHVHLIVKAFNIGKTNAHRKTAETLWEKAAEFPLADTDVILEKLYPKEIKSAGSILRETAVAADYNVPPFWIGRRNSKEAAARTIPPLHMAKQASPLQQSGYREIKMAEAERQKRERDIETCRLKASKAFDEVIKTTDQLVTYFKIAGCIPFNEVRDNAVILHGENAAKLLDHVSSKSPLFSKQAANRQSGPTTSEPYQLIRKCLDAGSCFLKEKQAYEEDQSKFFRSSVVTQRSEGNILSTPILSNEQCIKGSYVKSAYGVYMPEAEYDRFDPLLIDSLQKKISSVMPGLQSVPLFHQGHILPGQIESDLARDPSILSMSGLSTDQAKTDGMELKANNLYEHIPPHQIMPSKLEHVLDNPPDETEGSILRTKQAGPLVPTSPSVPGPVGATPLDLYPGSNPTPIRNAFRKNITSPIKLKLRQIFGEKPTYLAKYEARPPEQTPEIATWQLMDPAQVEDIRHIHIKSMLTDFMAHDNTLRNHRPEELSLAYSDLSRVAPRAMSIRPIANQALKKYVAEEGGSRGDAAHDLTPAGVLGQLMNIENQLKTRDAYPRQVDPFSGPTMPEAQKFH